MCLHKGHLRFWVCRAPKGESRGTQSLWQESEGVPQAAGTHCSPFLQGAPLRWLGVPRPQGGVQRDAVPLAGGMEDVPP